MPAKLVAKRALPIPKEHGAWAMLGVPLVVGAMVTLVARPQAGARGELIPALLLGLSVGSLYLARYPVYLWVRFPRRQREHGAWVVVTAGVGVAAGAVLVLGWGRWLLVLAGVLGLVLSLVHLWLVGERQERSVAGELLGVVGLTLTAPLAVYAASGLWGPETLVLWLVCFLFFGSSVFYVKMRVAAASLAKSRARTGQSNPSLPWRQKGRLGGLLLGYHLGALVGVGMLSLRGALPPLALVAFLPLALHQSVEVARLSPALNLRRVGFTLFGHSLLFGTLMVAAFYWG